MTHDEAQVALACIWTIGGVIALLAVLATVMVIFVVGSGSGGDVPRDSDGEPWFENNDV